VNYVEELLETSKRLKAECPPMTRADAVYLLAQVHRFNEAQRSNSPHVVKATDEEKRLIEWLRVLASAALRLEIAREWRQRSMSRFG
jgi:hypothetical protein